MCDNVPDNRSITPYKCFHNKYSSQMTELHLKLQYNLLGFFWITLSVDHGPQPRQTKCSSSDTWTQYHVHTVPFNGLENPWYSANGPGYVLEKHI